VGVDVARLLARGALQVAGVVLADELHHAAVEVTEVVRQVRVVDISEALPAELAITGEWAFAQEVVAERLGAELGDDVHRLDDVAERLADLLDSSRSFILEVDEAVGEDGAWGLHPGSVQHGGPERA